jgi:hypothetical protein
VERHVADRPVVLVHGYSDQGRSFESWRGALTQAGRDIRLVQVGTYVSLSNEITIKDIAEGFDRALSDCAGLSRGEEFDAIVHSTGMLVVREWLSCANGTVDKPDLATHRQRRLKRLIGLAPATWGSPIAHKGRSWLGAIFKGNTTFGPDFMEAGDQVLAALELGSSYTWALAERDFLGTEAVYSKGASTPYPFIFVGLSDYGWLKRVVTEPGTDGTVRWAGVGFNSRKVSIDLTVDGTRRNRVRLEPWKNVTVPLIFLEGLNHGSILSDPNDLLQQMVLEALDVSSGTAYSEWTAKHTPRSDAALKKQGAVRYQQFIVRAVDERGDGIDDFFIEIGTVPFDLDVHAYRDDRSYRCFHVDLDQLTVKPDALAIRVIAESGTELVAYQGYDSSGGTLIRPHEEGKWDAIIEFDRAVNKKGFEFFFPFTTTLVELRMNREPMPLHGRNNVFWFGERP